MPSVREQSPSRIAAGFGGTVNLMFSTLFIVVVIVLLALPCHVYFGTRSARAATFLFGRTDFQAWFQVWLVAGMITSILLGAVATIVPLWIGVRAFRETEF